MLDFAVVLDCARLEQFLDSWQRALVDGSCCILDRVGGIRNAGVCSHADNHCILGKVVGFHGRLMDSRT